MTYIQSPKSDTSGTVVYAAGTVDNTTRETGEIDVRSFKEIDFVIYLTASAGISTLSYSIEFSEKEAPSVDDDWTSVRIDNINLNSGVSDLKIYAPQEAVTGPETKTLSAPVRGRWMRLSFSADAGTGTLSVNAYRRV